MKKLRYILAAALALLCLLAACRKYPDTTGAGTSSQREPTSTTCGETEIPPASQTTKPSVLPEDWPHVTVPPGATLPGRDPDGSQPPDFTVPVDPGPNTDEPVTS